MERPEFAQHHALPIDAAALTEYLRKHLPGALGGTAPLRVQKFAGGQSNPTYKVESDDRAFVLRKKPTGTLLPTAHMIDREYRIMRALAESEVPVPTVHLYCADPTVIGGEFFIMDYVPGRIFWDPTLPQLPAAQRRDVYREMTRVLACLHRVDPAALGLADYGKAGNYFARQIKRWSQQYEAARTEELPAMDELVRWLPQNVPDDETTSLVHGDFRLDNMIFHPSEARILAILDWELSTLGDPLADLAYSCIPYHLSAPGREPLALAANSGTGIPTEAEYVADYLRFSGRTDSVNLRFHLAFSLFRSASIIQGVYKRGLSGNASSGAEAVGYRERVVLAANTAWDLVR
jgi:aminoglycoside phosphotransferase (APT) family kinase protein